MRSPYLQFWYVRQWVSVVVVVNLGWSWSEIYFDARVDDDGSHVTKLKRRRNDLVAL